MRCGISAACLVDLQSGGAGTQTPAGGCLFQSIVSRQVFFFKGKHDEQMDADVQQDVISEFCHCVTVIPRPGAHTRVLIQMRVASVLPTRVPLLVCLPQEELSSSAKTARSTAQGLAVQCEHQEQIWVCGMCVIVGK